MTTLADLMEISEKRAAQLWEKGKTIWFCPSKSFPMPDHPFNLAISLSKNGKPFKDVRNEFVYYNCNEEVGLDAIYFVRSEDAQE